MAGHGTDIILGGNAEFMARLKPCEILLPQFIHCTGSMGSFDLEDMEQCFCMDRVCLSPSSVLYN